VAVDDASGVVYVGGNFTGVVTLPMGEVLTATVEFPTGPGPEDPGHNPGPPALPDLFLLKLNPELGAIRGQVFNDLNNNGVNDDGAGVANVTVSMFEDLNNNGVNDGGNEPTFTTTTDTQGRYTLANVPVSVSPATFIVSQTVPTGGTQTFPAAPDTQQPVMLTEGEIRVGVDFGSFNPHTTTTYSSGDVPKTVEDRSSITSTIMVTDSFEIFNVNVQINVKADRLEDLHVHLIAPDGITRVELASHVHANTPTGRGWFKNTIFDDEAPQPIQSGSSSSYTGSFQPQGLLSDFDGTNVDGTWTLVIFDDLQGPSGDTAKLNSWSLNVTGSTVSQPGPPTIDSLSVNPDSVLFEEIVDVTLTANGVSDPDDNVFSVSFYRDFNGNGTLEVGTDVLFATDTDGTNGWSATDNTAALPLGTHSYFAVATDEAANDSNVVSATLTVTDPNVQTPPTIDSLSASRGSVKQSQTLTLTAVGVADADGTVDSVQFSVDDGNGIVPLGNPVTAPDGDGNWTLDVAIASNAPLGTYTFSAQATDNLGLTSNVVSTTVQVKKAKGGGPNSATSAESSGPVPLFGLSGSDATSADDTGDSTNLIVIVDPGPSVTSQPETDADDDTATEPVDEDEDDSAGQEAIDNLFANFDESLLDELLAV
jgi:subtilisin-like proprotein convertase family protein